MRVVLIEATPWDSAGAPVDVYLAGGGARGYDHRGRTSWLGGVVKEPRFAAGAGFDERGWTGRSAPQAGKVGWTPADKATLSGVAARQWINAPITVLAGDDKDAVPVWETILTGTVSSVTSRDGSLELTVADLSKKLDDPLLTARFAGTGGIEGDAATESRIKRRTWGKALNIEGRVLLKAYNVYEFSDPAFPLNAFVTVRDKGRDAAPAPTVLAWQGSIAATLAALQASAPAQGSGVVAPSIACVKWWTQPSGPLTADIEGEAGAGYTNLAGTIAQRVAAIHGPAMTAGTVAAINAVRAEEVGVHADDENESTASVLDRLLLPYSIFWVLAPAGTINLSEITFAAPVEAIAAQAVERVEAYRPTTSRRVGYQRSYRKHTDGEISAAVQLADVAGAGILASKDNVRFGYEVVQSNGSTVVGDAAALNSYVSVSAGGALSGGGGGQVTPAGLASSSGVEIRNNTISITSGSLNGIGTGTGTAVANTLVTISAGGALSGAGGGQVTPAGLEASSGVNIQNSLVTISSGTLSGIGAGTGTAVANSLVTIGANGAISGAGGGQVTFGGLGGAALGLKATLGWAETTYFTGRPANLAALAGTEGVNNALVSIGAGGALSGGGGGQVTFSGLGGGNVGLQSTLLLGGSYIRDATGANIITETGTYGVRNSGVSISNSGALSGGGGGQVTYGGLGGAALGLKATLGWAETTYFTGRPANLAALAGTEGVNNALVSISAGGALAGGGGGQVTPVGLETASGFNLRNSLITIGSGLLSGIGTGSGTAVANTLLTIGANGALSGGGGGQVTIGGLGYTGVMNAGSAGSWAIYSGSPTVSGNDVTFSAAGQEIHSQLIRGASRLSFKKVGGPNGGIMNAARTVYHYWALFSGQARAYSHVGQLGGAYTSGFTGNETFWVEYRGDAIVYGWDDVAWNAVAATPDQTFHGFTSSGGAAGDRTYDLQFTPTAIRPVTGSTIFDASGNTLTDSGTYGLRNVNVTIGSNGTLSGGGGGQVTLAGIDTPGVIGRTAKLDATTGRVSDPRAYNTQAILGPLNTSSIAPTYTVGGSNVTVGLPAHDRKIAGPSGPVTLSYGSVSGVVAFSTYWAAWVDDPSLTGFASPSATFTSNPDDLLYPNRYQIASGITPAAGGSGGSTTGGGGAGSLPRPGGGVYP